MPPIRSLSHDWIARVSRLEYGLSPAIPARPDVYFHPEPTPLKLDYHSALELGMVLEGEHERHYEDLVMRAGPGQVWLCAMWEPHGWRGSVPGTRELVIIFIPELLGDERVEGLSWLDVFSRPPAERPQLRTEAAPGRAADRPGTGARDAAEASELGGCGEVRPAAPPVAALAAAGGSRQSGRRRPLRRHHALPDHSGPGVASHPARPASEPERSGRRLLARSLSVRPSLPPDHGHDLRTLPPALADWPSRRTAC